MSRPSRFEGSVGRTVADSTPWYDEPPHPGADAPNVVVVLLDDTGFAQFGCYGSDIDTPNIDALAADGVQFTNFHVTPLCSPTRASLLTGRSQHAVGMRSVSNFRTGFPNQLGHITNHAATVAEVLRDVGYATFCVGKWHLAPMEQCSAAGPFDQWPLGRGFDRFYGFLEGETDQFHPDLVCDNHPISPPGGPDDGYHVSEDLIDRLLEMLSDSTGVRPDRPFFAYVPFGATHAPHQAPQAYLDKYRATPAATPGTTCPPTSVVWPAVCRRRSPRSSTTPTPRSDAWSTASVVWGSSTTRSSWCSPTTGRRRRADRSA